MARKSSGKQTNQRYYLAPRQKTEKSNADNVYVCETNTAPASDNLTDIVQRVRFCTDSNSDTNRRPIE